MSETEHQPERELEALQDQADSLGDRISETREQWESKKLDPNVPGAGGDPQAAESEDPQATAYPAKGNDGSLGEDLPADEPLDRQDPANEDL
jgi:hypothetical protein